MDPELAKAHNRSGQVLFAPLESAKFIFPFCAAFRDTSPGSGRLRCRPLPFQRQDRRIKMHNGVYAIWMLRIFRMFLKSRVASSLVPRVLAMVLVAAFAHPLAAQTWTATGSMTTGRYGHTATLLTNGQVLIAGGQAVSSSGPSASAELYNPTTGTFTATASMTTPRTGHTATRLNNGMVLIAGGVNNSAYVAGAELYDPTTGAFTVTGSMSIGRNAATATLLSNGTILIAGGSNASGSELASAELYDPTNGTFTATGSMTTTRDSHTATLLGNGQVLIAGGGTGGQPNTPQASAELYDPTTGTFTATGSMSIGRNAATATLLNNGEVLVAGGSAQSYGGGCPCQQASAERYDPTTGVFNLNGSMTTPRDGHTATLLTSGQVLIAAGSNGSLALASAELYDSTTGTFTATGSMTNPRQSLTATLLNAGTVLVAGGYNTSGVITASGELYQPPPPPYSAFIQQPINSDGSSVFKATRGVVPVKFTLALAGVPTCQLPPATIAVTRTAGGTLGSIDESVYVMSADSGSNFRIDSTACQYVYNLSSSSLGVGSYRVDITINVTVVGSAAFALK